MNHILKKMNMFLIVIRFSTEKNNSMSNFNRHSKINYNMIWLRRCYSSVMEKGRINEILKVSFLREYLRKHSQFQIAISFSASSHN